MIEPKIRTVVMPAGEEIDVYNTGIVVIRMTDGKEYVYSAK
jgi:hypothetical protein